MPGDALAIAREDAQERQARISEEGPKRLKAMPAVLSAVR